jgi:hypothetical protein
MKKSRLTDQQIALASKPAESGAPGEVVCRKLEHQTAHVIARSTS